MQLGRKIQAVRLQKKLTQKEVVGEYMTRNMLSKIENGSATPSVKTLGHIAGALGVPVSYFLSDTGGVTIDESQINEIMSLCDALCADGQPAYSAGVGLCIKGRALLCTGDAEGAVALLSEVKPERCDIAALGMIYCVLEDAYKAMDDYKMAYEYATRRISL